MFSFFSKWSDFNDHFLLSSASAPSSVKSSKKYSSIILEFRSLPGAELRPGLAQKRRVDAWFNG